MRETAQKRALRNYRSRLTKRGIARFEVLGLDADRDLIRSVARRLAEDGPDSPGFEPPSAGRSLMIRQREAEFLKRCVGRRL